MRRTFGIVMLCTALLPIATMSFAEEQKPASPIEAPVAVPVVRSPQPAPCITSAMRTLQPRMAEMLAIRLKMTNEQKQKLVDLLVNADKELAPKIEAQRAAAQSFVTALANKASTEADLTAAAEKAMKAETELVDARVKTFVALRAQLTAEQNEAFSQIMAQYTMLWQQTSPAATPATPTPAPAAPAEKKAE